MAGTASTIRVLHVDDDRELAALTTDYLERADDRIVTETAPSASDALSVLDDHAVDCIVSDHDMPGMNGLEFLDAVRADYPDLPFILFTGKGSEEIASEAISAGVSDYLQKKPGTEQYELLANRIGNAVEQRRAASAVERAEQRLRELAENSNDALWMYSGDWEEIEFVNSAYEEIWGQSVERLRADPSSFLDAVHPDDRDRVRDAASRVSAGESIDLEFRVNEDEGYRRWVWVQAEPIFEAEGDGTDGSEVARVVGFTRDVTDRKRGNPERELERYRRIVETMGDGVYSLDEAGNFVHVNEYLAELSGYDRERWQSADPDEFFAAEDIEAFEAAIRSLLSADEAAVRTVEAELLTAAGDAVPIEVNLTLRPMDDGEFRGTVGVVREISDRRERERELEQYETIVQTIPDEVYMLDAEGRFTSIIPPTDADLTTTGYEPAELVGEHVSIIMDDDDVAAGEREIRGLLADDDRLKASFEMETITKDGRRVPNENHIALLPMEDGEFRGTVGVLRDITDGKQRERELRRQNERLERLVGVVSHDLRNPLNVAESRLAFAREECDNEHLDHVAESHQRMETLIDDLLTLARTGERASDVGPVDLGAVAEACREAVESDAATLHVETDRTVVADEGRLARLLENLYRNAVEHGGDAVTVTVGALEDGFFVADDGPGIPPDERDAVFRSGYTTAEDGTGFGLSIVEEIATAHGWEIAVAESDEGGTRFEITGVEFA
ncbi:PAS domain S-box protein [Halorientalis halophila]|uniref:hybrid sensor histidine kinase/response regulator n=1 Tax=Halorientalis halophila TaxID=3108499 RepID=UPI003009D9E5